MYGILSKLAFPCAACLLLQACAVDNPLSEGQMEALATVRQRASSVAEHVIRKDSELERRHDELERLGLGRPVASIDAATTRVETAYVGAREQHNRVLQWAIDTLKLPPRTYSNSSEGGNGSLQRPNLKGLGDGLTASYDSLGVAFAEYQNSWIALADSIGGAREHLASAVRENASQLKEARARLGEMQRNFEVQQYALSKDRPLQGLVKSAGSARVSAEALEQAAQAVEQLEVQRGQLALDAAGLEDTKSWTEGVVSLGNPIAAAMEGVVNAISSLFDDAAQRQQEQKDRMIADLEAMKMPGWFDVGNANSGKDASKAASGSP